MCIQVRIEDFYRRLDGRHGVQAAAEEKEDAAGAEQRRWVMSWCRFIRVRLDWPGQGSKPACAHLFDLALFFKKNKSIK